MLSTKLRRRRRRKRRRMTRRSCRWARPCFTGIFYRHCNLTSYPYSSAEHFANNLLSNSVRICGVTQMYGTTRIPSTCSADLQNATVTKNLEIVSSFCTLLDVISSSLLCGASTACGCNWTLKERKQMGYIMRGCSFLRTTIEGRMKGKMTTGRPRVMLLD